MKADIIPVSVENYFDISFKQIVLFSRITIFQASIPINHDPWGSVTEITSLI